MAEQKTRKKGRGLAGADAETRKRVARLGGLASHGGGRRKGSRSIS